MAEIRHLENRHNVICFYRRWSDFDKISETGAEWHVDCGDVVEIETKCRIPIWRTFGRIQWHVIPEPPATLQGAATWRIQCNDPIATCDIAGCCHRANPLSWFQSHMPQCTVLPPGEFNDMSSQSQVSSCGVGLLPLGKFTVMIPEPHATLHGPAIWRNQCHDCATLQGVRIPSAILKIVFRYIFFVFVMQFGLWQSSFRIVSDNSIRHIENRFPLYFFLFS